MMVVIYVASLIRSVTALHDLINNKIELTAFESGEKKKKAVRELHVEIAT